MKKLIALTLSILMLFILVAVPVSAAGNEKHEKTPIIFIAGSSVDICDAEGNIISTGFDVLTDDDEGDMSKEDLIESIVNITLPFVLEGLPQDKWDNYGKALYEELAPIWDETQLDGDGNAKYGTGVSAAEIKQWDDNALKDRTNVKNFYLRDFDFRYDWRLSPYDHADRLHAYIKQIIKSTGCKQVALVGRCLGGNVITAYLDKYGDQKLVKKVVYDEVMSNGSVVINDCFSGKIKFSDKHIQAYLLESEYYGKQDVGIDLIGVNDLLLEVAERLFDLLTQLGATQGIFNTVYSLYERLYSAFMPSILLATGIGTWASYWSSLCDKDFDTALNLIFGKEGTESRAAYAGLIEKLNYIRTRIVKTRTLDGDANLYKKFVKEYGVEIGIIAGYGLVNPPIIESVDKTGDIVVDTESASFGATTAGVFDTFPQEYIDKQIAAGKGKYISLDKKIDASTCLFPETTWFIKNKHHDTYHQIKELSEYFTQYTNVTADSNKRNISRFLIVDKNNIEKAVNMTEDNMADGPWLQQVEQEPTKESKLMSLFKFLASFFDFLTRLFSGQITL